MNCTTDGGQWTVWYVSRHPPVRDTFTRGNANAECPKLERADKRNCVTEWPDHRSSSNACDRLLVGLLGGAGRSGLHPDPPKRISALAAEVSLPLPRSLSSTSVFFLTAQTFEKRFYLQTDRMCKLLLDVLLNYREKNEYLLHEFVIMPNHFHLLLTPMRTLARAMQCIKGGFSYRVKRELNFPHTFWQTSFYDRRVRDVEEYRQFKNYIYMNPVRKHLCDKPEEWEWSSASGTSRLDEAPQRLKPETNCGSAWMRP